MSAFREALAARGVAFDIPLVGERIEMVATGGTDDVDQEQQGADVSESLDPLPALARPKRKAAVRKPRVKKATVKQEDRTV